MLTTMKLKHVQRIRANGRDYYYWRPTGRPFKSAFGTAAFVAEHAKLLAAHESRPAPRNGTLGGLILAYRASPEFLNDIGAQTRLSYERAFKVLAPAVDDAVAEIDQPTLLALRDRVFKKRGRWMANYIIDVLSVLFAWGQPRGWVKSNPAMGIPSIRRPRALPRANRPWTASEFAVVVKEAEPALATAIYLGRYAMLRITDAIAVDWRQYDGRALRLTVSKNGREIEIVVTAPLRAQLDKARQDMARRNKQRADARPTGPIVRSRLGRAYTRSGLQSVLHRLLRDLEARGFIAKGLTFHGLRKSMATLMADEGVDELKIAAAMGETPEASRVYTAPASQKRLARHAFALIETKIGDDGEQGGNGKV